jgi:hypothetical protein
MQDEGWLGLKSNASTDPTRNAECQEPGIEKKSTTILLENRGEEVCWEETKEEWPMFARDKLDAGGAMD